MAHLKGIGRLSLLIVTALTGCFEPLAPERPVREMPSVALQELLRPRTFSDALRDASIRSPGLTGLSMDPDGTIAVASTSATISSEAASAVRDLFRQMNRADLVARPMRLKLVKYDYQALESSLYSLQARVLGRVSGIVAGGVQDHNGQIFIGVDNAVAATEVREEAQKLGIPDDMLNVELSTRRKDVQGLRDVHTHMRGGLSVSRTTGSFCSIGFVGWLKDEFGQPDFTYRIITTASHCTSNETEVIGDMFGQPLSSRRVGVEVDEALIYPTGHSFCATVAPNRCRYADVAVIRIDDSVATAAGSAAKSSPTTWPNNPPYVTPPNAYVGSGVIGSSVVGEILTKVGATSGQRTGALAGNCEWRLSGGTSLLANICIQRMTAFSDDGDSGGTVYIPYHIQNPNPNPRAVGTMFQADLINGVQYTFLSPTGGMNAALGNKYYYAW